MTGAKLTLIGGGARSGKSALALSLARRRGSRRLFLATAQAHDAEMAERVSRHRRERGKDFVTFEEPRALGDVLRAQVDFDVVVLDCLTLWLSNLLLDGLDAESVLGRVDELVATLRSRSGHAIVITNEVGMGIVPDNALARAFRDLAGAAHQRLSAAADEIYLALIGTVLRIKPDLALVNVHEPS
jgi:adenosylcobinamide kinase/adenosylcobinamide-phosphate guanylyltransferase